jgi:hypothetical protein
MGVRLRFAVSFTDETVPAVTAKAAEAEVVVIDPDAALTTWPVPATVGLMEIASTKPLAVITAFTAPLHAVEVRATVPVHVESTLPLASWADTRTPIAVPATVVVGTAE